MWSPFDPGKLFNRSRERRRERNSEQARLREQVSRLKTELQEAEHIIGVQKMIIAEHKKSNNKLWDFLRDGKILNSALIEHAGGHVQLTIREMIEAPETYRVIPTPLGFIYRTEAWHRRNSDQTEGGQDSDDKTQTVQG